MEIKMKNRITVLIMLSIASLILFAVPVAAESWPALSRERWASMTVDELYRLLETNDINESVEGGWFPGRTAIFFAALDSSLDVVSALLNEGADINTADEQSYTPLLSVLWSSNDPRRVRFLLDNGADVHAVNRTGATSAMIATWIKGFPETLPVLLEYGADLSAVDDFGRSVAHAAVQHNDSIKTVEWLMDHGVTFSPNQRSTSMLLQLVGRHGRSPDMVRYLVEELGFDVNGSSHWDTRTPLHLAQWNTNVERISEPIREALRELGGRK